MQASTVHITKLQVNSNDPSQHLDWLAQLMMVGVETASVLSAEILPPSSASPAEWILVQRFHNEAALAQWSTSPGRKQLLSDIEPFKQSGLVSLTEELDAQHGTTGSVAAAIVTQLKPGQEANYFKYATEFQIAQARRPGYRGAYIQPPTSGTPGSWTTVVRFDSPEALDRWISSDQRKELIAKAQPLVDSWDLQLMQTSFPGWFNTADGSKGPANWKTAMLIILGLYPIIMVSIRFVDPLFKSVPLPVEKFFGTIMTVSFTTWISMPLSIKAFRPWLFPTKSTPKWVGPVSIASLIIIYIVETALMSLLR